MKKPLKLALIAPLVTPIAPPFVGGAQVLLHDLAIGLARRGHDVTLYASDGSNVPGVTTIKIAIDNAQSSLADFNRKADAGVLETAFFTQGKHFLETFLAINRGNYDLAHAHAFDWPVYAFGALSGVPTVHTVHLPAVDPTINEIIATNYQKTGVSRCVTVSQACAATYASYFQFDRIIYNGLDVSNIPFGEKGQDFLLFVGRMSPEKGVDKAIQIALRAGKKLVLAGGIYDKAFFEAKIAPYLAAHPDKLDYRGVLNRNELYNLMSQAEGLLFTSQWEEAFGLSLAEAQAAGLPAIAFNKGAVPELVVEGETGFLLEVNDLEGAVAAIPKLSQIDRAACRGRIATTFTIEKMLDDYEAYYYSIVNQ